MAKDTLIIESHPKFLFELNLTARLNLLSKIAPNIPTIHATPETTISALSSLLILPCSTRLISTIFRPLLIELIARSLISIAEPEITLQQCCLDDMFSYFGGADAINDDMEIDIDSDMHVSPKHDQDGNLIHSPQKKISNNEYSMLELTLLALSRLLPVCPHLLGHTILLATDYAGIYLNILETQPHKIKIILITLYNLLRASPSTFIPLFDYTKIYKFLKSENVFIKAYTCNILSIVLGLSNAKSQEFTDYYVDVDRAVEVVSFKTSGTVGNSINDVVDGYLQNEEFLPILRLIARNQDSMEKLYLFYDPTLDQAYESKDDESIFITAKDLSPLTIDLCGILLPLLPTTLINYNNINQNATKDDNSLVLTHTTRKHLHTIALGLSMKMPILLEGACGVGKTSLVEEAARTFGNRELLKIHLGDQTDSKILLGTYVSTSTPGSFRWQPGVLTTAVSEGRWILVEDIDLAPAEVVSVLIPLLESRTLFIPTRGEKIIAKDSFRLFATKTTSSKSGKKSTASNGIADGLWNKIKITHLTDLEIEQVLKTLYPALQSQVPIMLDAFNKVINEFSSASYGSVGGSMRLLTLRDLIKWFKRLNSRYSNEIDQEDTSLEIREDLFREALDCFVGMISNDVLKNCILETLGNCLNIPIHRIQFFSNVFVPQLNTDDEKNLVRIGRFTLSKSINKDTCLRNSSTFATLSHSLRLMEKLAACISLVEPVLLVGETGTGKTTVVQHLATQLNKKLCVVNMSQQSDSSDLLGGFKPVDARHLIRPIKEEFDSLFKKTFSVKKNMPFLDAIKRVWVKGNWDQLCVAFGNGIQMAEKVFNQRKKQSSMPSFNDQTITKKIKTLDYSLQQEWLNFKEKNIQLHAQLENIKSKFLFSFVEGTLVQAIKNGDWVLLDEVNLASAETLECLSGLLQGKDGSLLLMEKGDTKPITRHSEFRLFACMNPANDAGKRDLPPGLRSRFSEFWVDSPDRDLKDLGLLVRQYLRDHLPPGNQGQEMVDKVVAFYTSAKQLAQSELYDGANHRVHFSIRTLSRSLSYAVSIASAYGLRRALYEGFVMTFLTQLNRQSQSKLAGVIEECILVGINNPKKFIHRIPNAPKSALGKEEQEDDRFFDDPDPMTSKDHVLFESFWLQRGTTSEVLSPESLSSYVLTPSVEANLANLARAVMSHKYPVLIQGPTSAGKTSMIEYLAKRTGHRFVRINNHEHTDLQEYVGSYVADDAGKLVFKEGILVEALRNGYWLVLDELNLAPSDVLEALNRLLDDNRELFIPETQTIIRPHPQFMLFATQNPPGLYGGRKVLSRAFRNRFLELHFDEIPENELSTILEKRCLIAPSYANKIVDVFKTLSNVRQKSKIFEGKHGYVTLRDLFRWAERKAVGYQELAEDGYMLLSERIRREEDKVAVVEALESAMKVKINVKKMYECEFDKVRKHVLESYNKEALKDIPEIVKLLKETVWTAAMKRLFTLVAKCIQHQEPVLLVGETGCGKTTVCQVLAAYLGRTLHIVNAHQHSETADFLGSQRPVRGKDLNEEAFKKEVLLFIEQYGCKNDRVQLTTSSIESMMECAEKIISTLAPADTQVIERIANLRKLYKRSQTLFEWYDGPLIHAMRKGEMFLLDEISLADDSVLERLNSVLEPQRLLVLAEKTGSDNVAEEIYGAEGFEFLATMNPGGDYGKKELSPALRNRFTEIWCPQVASKEDLTSIIESKLLKEVNRSAELILFKTATKMLDYIDWFAGELKKPKDTIISLRDILAWVTFITSTPQHTLSSSFVHGGCIVLVDGIGVNPLFGLGGLDGSSIELLREKCRHQLLLISGQDPNTGECSFDSSSQVTLDSTRFGVDPFFIPLGPIPSKKIKFALKAPTTIKNCMRVLRALQLKKPILLEGSPGIGKTSLIANLAAVSGRNLVRINLSEQTDLADLFGSDLPVEDDEESCLNNTGPQFSWRDGPFLAAMKSGDWVLLDELNLASQQVLEGLNACLDHRGVVYIPELDREFSCSPDFRVFAAQNPQHQGGGRKGLPKSFVNRFTQVYVVSLTSFDLKFILSSLHPQIAETLSSKMISFIESVQDEILVKGSFGWEGGPWEFNLRDVLRWAELIEENETPDDGLKYTNILLPGQYMEMIFSQRMRNIADKTAIRKLFNKVFGYTPVESTANPSWEITDQFIKVGRVEISRSLDNIKSISDNQLEVLQSSLPILNTLMYCVKMKWMSLITGPTASGKTSIVRLLASLTGNRLEEFAMNGGVDTVELLGGFEQVDLVRRKEKVLNSVSTLLSTVISSLLSRKACPLKDFASAQELQEQYRTLSSHFDIAAARLLVENLEQLSYDLKIDLPSNCLEAPQNIRNLLAQYEKLEIAGVHGSFEWIDGTLIRALEEGHWVLIDNVNFCSPSVLDRLNPLLEPNGSLMVNERGLVNGQVKMISPHKNFRLFLTMDPKHGEISRAMRNRSIEVSLVGAEWINQQNYLDVLKVLNDLGVVGKNLPSKLLSLHTKMGEWYKECNLVGFRVGKFNEGNLTVFARLLIERAQRGELLERVALRSFDDIYNYQEICQGLSFEYIPASRHDTLVGLRSSIEMDLNEVSELLQSLSLNFQSVRERALDVFCSPTIFPDSISESLIAADARLANTCLITSLYNDSLYQISSKDLVNIRSRARQVLSELPTTGWKIALLWLFNTAKDVQSDEHREISDLTLALIQKEFKNESVLNVYDWPYAIKNLIIRVAEASLIENLVYSRVEKATLSQLSMVQCSYLYNCGHIKDTQLIHESVRWFNPLLSSMNQTILLYLSNASGILETIQFERLLRLVDFKDSFWKCVNKTTFEYGELALIVKNLHKYSDILRVIPHPEYFETLRKLADSLNLDSISVLRSVWKSEGVLCLRSEVLIKTMDRLKEVNDLLVPKNGTIKDLICHPIHFRDSITLNSIIEGCATIHYINESTEDNFGQLFQLIESLPEVLLNRLNSYTKNISERMANCVVDKVENLDEVTRINISLNTMVDAATKCLNIPLIPILDMQSIAEENQIILKLINVIRRTSSPTAFKREIVTMIPEINQLIDNALRSTFRPPLYLEPFKRLSWVCNESDEKIAIEDSKFQKFVNSILQDAVFLHFENLWCPTYSTLFTAVGDKSTCYIYDNIMKMFLESNDFPFILNSEYSGTKLLYHPLNSIMGMSIIVNIDQIPVYSTLPKLKQLSTLKDFWSKQAKGFATNSQSLSFILYILIMIEQILSGNKSELSQFLFLKISEIRLMITEKPVYSDFAALKSLLNTALIENSSHCGALDIPSIIHLVEKFIFHDEDIILDISQCLVKVACIFIRLYVPAIPVDPALFAKYKLGFSQDKLSLLEADLDTVSSMEKLISGNSSNSETKSITARLELLKGSMKKHSSQIALRPKISQISQICKDLNSLIENIISESVIENLISELLSPDTAVNARHKEKSLQDVLSAFISKGNEKYPMYRDILQPLMTVLYHVKNGFSVICEHSRSISSESSESLALLLDSITKLVNFSDSGSCAISNLEIATEVNKLAKSSEPSYSKQLTLKWDILMSLLLRWNATNCLTQFNHLSVVEQAHPLFLSLIDLWSASEDTRKDQEMKKDDLYKYKEQVKRFDTEEEMDEAALLEQFPDFYNEFSNIVNQNDILNNQELTVSEHHSEKEWIVVDDHILHRIRLIHQYVVDNSTSDKSFADFWCLAYQTSFDTAKTLLNSCKSAPKYLDESCRIGLEYMTNIASKKLKGESGSTFESYNFYKDSNVHEASQIVELLLGFDLKISELLLQWPEHIVLSNLSQICNRIAAFSIMSPLPKFMTGIEILLQKCEDWEKFASQAVSIKYQMEKISTLIVKWRRLELESWKQLLEMEDEQYYRQSSKIWFHLYRLVVNVSLVSEEETTEQEVLKDEDILSMLDQMCLSSNFGEFAGRLEMLIIFYKYLLLLQKDLPNLTSRILNISNMLKNVYNYYNQFLTGVLKQLSDLRKPILKELEDYVRIASWKEVTVYALRESAVRTHHHLHKYLKKYREILSMSVREYVNNNSQDAVFEGSLIKIDSLISLLTAYKIPPPQLIKPSPLSLNTPRLQHIPQFLKKLASFGNESQRSCDSTSRVVEGLNDLSISIIDRVKEFSDMSLEANSSTAKSQKMVRKKSLVDLLKFLQRIGLSPRTKTTTRNLFQNPLTTFSVCSPDLETVFLKLAEDQSLKQILLNVWKDSSLYFPRILSKMTKLKNVTSLAHSADVSDREVEKAVSFCENLFEFVLTQREKVAVSLSVFAELSNIAGQWQDIYSTFEDKKLVPGDIFTSALLSSGKVVDEILVEISKVLLVLKERKDLAGVVLTLEIALKTTCEIQEELVVYSSKYLVKGRGLIDVPLVFSDKLALFVKVAEFLEKITMELTGIIVMKPDLGYMLAGLLNITQSYSVIEIPEIENGVSLASPFSENIFTDCVEKILVSCQELRKQQLDVVDNSNIISNPEILEDEGEIDQFGLNEFELSKLQNVLIDSLNTKHLKNVVIVLKQIASLTCVSAADEHYAGKLEYVKFVVARIYPLLNHYLLYVEQYLLEISSFHRVSCKLESIMCSVFAQIIEKGFCLPQGTEEEGEEQETEDTTGMGIGEGQGTKDVSDEIEDQEDVEGLKNEQQEKTDGQPIAEEKNAIEMDADFDGQLEDVQQDGAEGDSDQDEKDGDEDHDEEMGDLDDSADVVDEAVWGDEDTQDNSKDEKTEKDSSATGPDVETVAKDIEEEGSNEPQNEKAENPEDPTTKEDSNEDEKCNGDDGEINEDTDDKYEENHGVEVKDKFNEDPLNDEQDLELPEDMEMDDQDGGAEDDGNVMPEDNEENTPEQSESEMNKEDEETQKIDDDDEKMDGLETNTGDLGEEEEPQEVTPEEMEKDDNTKAQDGGIDEGVEDETPNEEAAEDEVTKTLDDQTKHNANQPLGVEGSGGDPMAGENNDNNTSANYPDALETNDSLQPNSSDQQQDLKQNQTEPSPNNNNKNKPNDPNPRRSLGDAMKQWMSRLKSLSDPIETDQNEPQEEKQNNSGNGEDVDKGNDFEFLQDDSETFDAQVLDVATAEQANEVSLENQPTLNEDEVSEDVEMMEEEPNESDQPKNVDDSTNIKSNDLNLNQVGIEKEPHKKEDLDARDKDLENQDEEEKLGEGDGIIGERSNEEMLIDKEGEEVSKEEEHDEEEIDTLDYDELRRKLEEDIVKWNENGKNLVDSQQVWRTCCNLTRDLSFDLCEQLRLILEPTLATKLKGDYRTGKRLNMRKVIPYIASQFKKDKIWMRRTRPSKRTYQIMLSIDDSKSMAESKSIQLAYQSLALISKALSQLEAGDISVVSFGQEVKLLHPFEKPFSDEAGAAVVNRFTFDQDGTHVKEMMHSCIEILDQARSSSNNAGDLWQLQIVISDGICESHEKIQNLVRKAAENRIMVVFIVLDNRQNKDSLTKLTTVTYEDDPMTGRPVLKMTKYMDTFPFDYFVILEEINMLPEILSETLRQYFMLIGNN